MEKLQKRNIGVFLILAVIFLFIGYVFYLMFYPVKTLVVNEARVITHEIKPGDTFVYNVDYCKYTTKPAIVYRTFHEINEQMIETFPSVQTISVPGCHSTHVPLQTNINTPPGNYYLLVDVVFQVNPLQTQHVIFKTDNFKIL